ncbi:hydrogenase accessory protein [Dinoroseobacter sp. S375]|uniref:hydrogenase accessory protein n=1 Tax=Dinoroseobacter sp. S375 TaxID=3415136 RepID=UPI003C7C2746
MAFLITRLTDELGWARLEDLAAFEALLAAPGAHCVFAPGDPARNLESTDVAVILPEIRQAFQNRFDVAIATPAVEQDILKAAGVFKTPSLIFFRDGAMIGAIPKVRDWDDYMARVTRILQLETA